MAEIVTYKPGAYCQIKFPTGERVLISCAQTDIKIMKLSLGGLLPTRTIADWPISNLDPVISIFADRENPTLHPLDAIKNRLMACSSIGEVEKLCQSGGTPVPELPIGGPMAKTLIFSVYGADMAQARDVADLLQRTLQNEGVEGFAVPTVVVPEVQGSLGISSYPAVMIEDVLLWQGSAPPQDVVCQWIRERSKGRGQERIVNKQDADRIFGLNRAEWNAQAKQMVHPQDWKVRLSPFATGTGVMAFDPKTGMGLAIQPFFPDAQTPPDMLIVGSYYPAGTFREFSDQLKRDMEAAARSDLGSGYTLRISFSRMTSPAPGFDVVEVIITRAEQ